MQLRLKPAIAAGMIVALGLSVATIVAMRRSADDAGLILYGNVDIRDVDLSFYNEGRVTEMLVEEGDPVEKGQLLATIEDARFVATVQSAEARVAAQQAVVARMEHGSRPEEVAKARADLAAATAAWRGAQAELEKQETAIVDHATSQHALDLARAEAGAAKSIMEASRQLLQLAIEGPREEDKAAELARLRATEADLALARDRLEDTRLFASVDGVVLTRIQEPGAVVLTNQPVYTIALSDPVWVRTYVSELNLGRVHPGMRAEIVTDSRPDRPYPGWVGFISPVAEFTPKPVETPELRTSLVYRLRVYAENPDHGLRQGMPVTVRLLEDGDEPTRGADEAAGSAPPPSPRKNRTVDPTTIDE